MTHARQSPPAGPPPLDPAHLDQLRAHIAGSGYIVQVIVEPCPWGYTVGLTEAGLPELVVRAGATNPTTWSPYPQAETAVALVRHLLASLADQFLRVDPQPGRFYRAYPPIAGLAWQAHRLHPDQAAATLPVAAALYGHQLVACQIDPAPGQHRRERALAHIVEAADLIRAGRPHHGVLTLLSKLAVDGEPDAYGLRADFDGLVDHAEISTQAFLTYAGDLMIANDNGQEATG